MVGHLVSGLHRVGKKSRRQRQKTIRIAPSTAAHCTGQKHCHLPKQHAVPVLAQPQLQLVTSKRGVCGGPLAFNYVGLVSQIAFCQSLACANFSINLRYTVEGSCSKDYALRHKTTAGRHPYHAQLLCAQHPHTSGGQRARQACHGTNAINETLQATGKTNCEGLQWTPLRGC
jgi:hypothetical protein